MHQNQVCSQENVAQQTKTILIVEDDVAVGSFLVTAITEETPHHAYVVANGFQALHACATDAIDLIILDYSLPLMNGIELYDKLSTLEEYHMPPAMMISAYLPVNELAKRQLPSLRKPLELQNLLDLIEHMLQ